MTLSHLAVLSRGGASAAEQRHSEDKSALRSGGVAPDGAVGRHGADLGCGSWDDRHIQQEIQKATERRHVKTVCYMVSYLGNKWSENDDVVLLRFCGVEYVHAEKKVFRRADKACVGGKKWSHPIELNLAASRI